MTADTAGLAAGPYTATVTVAAPGVAGRAGGDPGHADGDARRRRRRWRSRPRRSRSPARSAGAAPAAKTLAVTNTGSGPLTFTAAGDAPWLSVTPACGGAPQTLTVTASPAGLAAGTYTGAVTVTAPGASGSPRAIPVTFT